MTQKGQTGIFILVGILVLAVIATGAFYLGKQATPKPLVVTSTPQPTVSLSATPDETANWKIYTDGKYFTIKYPPGWELGKRVNAVGIHLFNPKSIKTFKGNGGINEEIATEYFDIFSVKLSTKNAYQEAEEFKNGWKNSVNIQSEDASGMGIDLVLYDDAGEGSSGRNIAISNNTLLGIMNASIEHLGDNKTENKILDSFKFLK